MQNNSILSKLTLVLTCVLALLVFTSQVTPNLNHLNVAKSHVAYADEGDSESVVNNDEETRKAAEQADKAIEGSSDDDGKKNNDKPTSGEVAKNGNVVGIDNNMWVMYAQMVMGTVEKKEDEDKKKNEENKPSAKDIAMHPIKSAKKAVTQSFDGAVSGIISDGGTSYDIPFNSMHERSKEILEASGSNKNGKEDGSAGRLVASFLATYSHYNYINTVSGNSIAVGVQQFGSGFIRVISGLFISIGLGFYALINALSDLLVNTLLLLNPYHFLGFEQGADLLPKGNFVSEALINFFDGLGLNGAFVTTLMELGMLIILFIFGIRVILLITRARFKEGGQQLGQWLVRVFIIFGFFPIMSLTASGFGSTMQEIKKNSTMDDSPVMTHLLDSHVWASGTNLSPTGFSSAEHPNAYSKDSHIDKRFDPAKPMGRNIISSINKQGYKVLYGKTSDTEISWLLLGRWVQGDTFNVNTYMGDLIKDEDATGNGYLLPGASNYQSVYGSWKGVKQNELDKKLPLTTISDAMWSASQDADKDHRKPDFKDFNPALKVGVKNDNSFSTQSVVLMLQTSIADNSAKFYAYNIAPSGEQSNAKNFSTVTTQWREITMPGDGVLGMYGSYISLLAESLEYVIIGLAVIMALLTTNIFVSIILFVKQLFRAITLGSVNSAMATALLYFGMIFSAMIALFVPGIFISLLQSFTGGLKGLTGDIMLPGAIDIVVSLFGVFLAYYISWGAKVAGGETPVKLMVTLPVKMAMAFESRVAQLDKNGGVTSFRGAFRGASEEASRGMRNTSSEIGRKFGQDGKAVSNTVSGQTVGRGTGAVKGAGKGFSKGAVKGAVKGFGKGAVAGGIVGGAVNAVRGAGTEGLRGAKAGATSGALNGHKDKKAQADAHNDAMNKAGFGTVRKTDKDGNKLKSVAGLRREAKGGRKGQNKVTPNRRRGLMQQLADAQSRNLATNTNYSAKDAVNKYGALPFGINPNERLRDQSLANGNALRDFTGDSDIYEKETPDELRHYSHVAGTSASDAIDENGNQLFSRDEADSLRHANDEDEFAERLGQTENGMAYAMNTTSAKTMLQDTEFSDDNGNIDLDEIEKTRDELDHKFDNGTMTEDDWKRKAQLDNAFMLGAQEQYRRPNNKFTDNTTANDKIREQNNNATDKDGRQKYNRKGKTNQRYHFENGMLSANEIANKNSSERFNNSLERTAINEANGKDLRNKVGYTPANATGQSVSGYGLGRTRMIIDDMNVHDNDMTTGDDNVSEKQPQPSKSQSTPIYSDSAFAKTSGSDKSTDSSQSLNKPSSYAGQPSDVSEGATRTVNGVYGSVPSGSKHSGITTNKNTNSKSMKNVSNPKKDVTSKPKNSNVSSENKQSTVVSDKPSQTKRVKGAGVKNASTPKKMAKGTFTSGTVGVLNELARRENQEKLRERQLKENDKRNKEKADVVTRNNKATKDSYNKEREARQTQQRSNRQQPRQNSTGVVTKPSSRRASSTGSTSTRRSSIKQPTRANTRTANKPTTERRNNVDTRKQQKQQEKQLQKQQEKQQRREEKRQLKQQKKEQKRQAKEEKRVIDKKRREVNNKISDNNKETRRQNKEMKNIRNEQEKQQKATNQAKRQSRTPRVKKSNIDKMRDNNRRNRK